MGLRFDISRIDQNFQAAVDVANRNPCRSHHISTRGIFDNETDLELINIQHDSNPAKK